MIKKSNPVIALGLQSILNAGRLMRQGIKGGMGTIEGGPGLKGYKRMESVVNKVAGPQGVLRYRQVKSIPNSILRTGDRLLMNEARMAGANIRLPQRMVATGRYISNIAPNISKLMITAANKMKTIGQHTIASSLDQTNSSAPLLRSVADDAIVALTGAPTSAARVAMGVASPIVYGMGSKIPGVVGQTMRGAGKTMASISADLPVGIAAQTLKRYGSVLTGGGFLPLPSQMPDYNFLRNVQNW